VSWELVAISREPVTMSWDNVAMLMSCLVCPDILLAWSLRYLQFIRVLLRCLGRLYTCSWSLITWLGSMLPCFESMIPCLLSLYVCPVRLLAWSWGHLPYIGTIKHEFKHVDMSWGPLNMSWLICLGSLLSCLGCLLSRLVYQDRLLLYQGYF
jgi:hypothetical protein